MSSTDRPLPLADEIYHRPPNGPSQLGRRFLVFFITGNPGLIEYYRIFLDHLWDKLRMGPTFNDNVYVYGTSLAGFNVTKSERGKVPHDLNDQIDHVIYRLHQAVDNVHLHGSYDPQHRPVQVILVGHSVGSYILLEVVAR